MVRVTVWVLVLLTWGGAWTVCGAEAPKKAPPPNGYLFSYFVGNGEDGLHLAWSEDGYIWRALNGGKSFLTPAVGEQKLMRDPSLLRGPDGRFHLVWTTGWHGKTIGYTSSADLIHWSQQKAIPVMAHEPKAANCWAPELFYDQTARQFLIVWSTTISGKFAGHRAYCTRTGDFKTFTPAALFFEPGYTAIDGAIVPFNGKYCLIFKDERDSPEGKVLRLAGSDSPYGPWSAPSKPFTRRMVEGPTWLKIGQEYIIYYDCFAEGHYGAVKTRDFEKWEDVTARLSMPQGIRHGTALPVPGEILAKLKENFATDGAQMSTDR